MNVINIYMYDSIIISDLHLGSPISQTDVLNKFFNKLESYEIQTKELILNGDVFDSWDFKRLRKAHWKVLSSIRSLSDQIKITWICGNHDGPSEIISHLLGVDVKDEYILKSGKNKILVLHGDKFDEFITEHPIITYLADGIYWLMQKIDPSFWMAKQAKRASKTFLRCADKIKKEAIKYAAKKGCDLVCTGHSHHAEVSDKYYNSGCWTELPCSFLVVENGEINLKLMK